MVDQWWTGGGPVVGRWWAGGGPVVEMASVIHTYAIQGS